MNKMSYFDIDMNPWNLRKSTKSIFQKWKETEIKGIEKFNTHGYFYKFSVLFYFTKFRNE